MQMFEVPIYNNQGFIQLSIVYFSIVLIDYECMSSRLLLSLSVNGQSLSRNILCIRLSLFIVLQSPCAVG